MSELDPPPSDILPPLAATAAIDTAEPTSAGDLKKRTRPIPADQARPLNLSQFDGPAFLMSPPLSYSAEVPNNLWMEDLTDEERVVRPRKAMRQFQVLYNFIASRALVSLVTAPANSGLPELVFTGSMGIVLNHLPDNNTVIISNFSSPSRFGEMDVAMRYFKEMGYRTYVPRAKFEGEAELKHLHDNIYVGGYGLRSEKAAYEELEQQFDMRVIKVRHTDHYLYRLEHSLFPMTTEKTVVCTEVFTRGELRELEKSTEVVPISRAEALPGLCSSVRMGSHILNASHINDLRAGSEAHQMEIDKNRRLEDICAANGLEVAFFNLSEFLKSGVGLASMVMHLNRHSYGFRLL